MKAQVVSCAVSFVSLLMGDKDDEKLDEEEKEEAK